jgi:hypothetical protein
MEIMAKFVLLNNYELFHIYFLTLRRKVSKIDGHFLISVWGCSSDTSPTDFEKLTAISYQPLQLNLLERQPQGF